MTTPRVVVVGAGVVGAAVTAELATKGTEVMLIDAARPAQGTSGSSFAWLNSNDKHPEEYHSLNVAGMEAHRRFATEHSYGSWYHSGGNVEWKLEPDERERLERRVTRLEGLGYPVKWLTRSEIIELEPDLDPERLPDDGFAFFPTEGWVDPPVLVAELLTKARSHGARIITNTSVTGFTMSRERIISVVAGTDRYDADIVINCAGPGADEVAAMAGVDLPLSRDPGLVVVTEPGAVSVRRILHLPDLELRPDGGGRLRLSSRAADQALQDSDGGLADAVDGLLTGVGEVFHQASGLRSESVRVGLRPIPHDRLPLLGGAAPVPNLYHAVTHSGVTLCLRIAELVSSLVLEGEELPDLYRLDERRSKPG